MMVKYEKKWIDNLRKGVLSAPQKILLYLQNWPFSPHTQSSGTHTPSSYFTSLTIFTLYSFTFLNHSSLISLT